MPAILDFRSEICLFYLQITPMLPTKFQVNWPFGSGEEAKKKKKKKKKKYRFTRWAAMAVSTVSGLLTVGSADAGKREFGHRGVTPTSVMV